MRGHSGSHPYPEALDSCMPLNTPQGTLLRAGTHIVPCYLAWEVDSRTDLDSKQSF